MTSPRPKEMIEVLVGAGVDSSALIVTAEPEANVIKSPATCRK